MKYILPQLLVLLLSVCAHGQNIPIDSFFTTGAKWTQVAYSSGMTSSSSGFNKAEGFVFRIERDTFVAGTKYHLLSIERHGGYSFHTVYPTTTFTYWRASNNYEIIGRIRVDSNRVYFTRDSTGAFPIWAGTSYFGYGVERQLYDFNLTIGSIVVPGTPPIYVTDVDSVVMTNGVRIKKYNLSYQYWLEGIGSATGLIFVAGLAPGPFMATSQKLLCYDHPSFAYHVYYPDSILLGNLQNNCFDATTIDVKDMAYDNEGEVKIYPNPLAGDDLKIESSQLQQASAISVYDVTGRCLKTLSKPFVAPDVTCSMPEVPGVYFIKIEFESGKTYTAKVIKL